MNTHENNNANIHPAYEIFLFWQEDQRAKRLERFLLWRDVQVAKEKNDKWNQDLKDLQWYHSKGYGSRHLEIDRVARKAEERLAERIRRKAIVRRLEYERFPDKKRDMVGYDPDRPSWYISSLYSYSIHRNPLFRVEKVKDVKKKVTKKKKSKKTRKQPTKNADKKKKKPIDNTESELETTS